VKNATKIFYKLIKPTKIAVGVLILWWITLFEVSVTRNS
jgi:hypothetical protein